MIKYRHHRGSLADAMKTAQEFASIEEMKSYICDDLNADGLDWIGEDDISIGEPLGDDPRVGWKDVRYVLTRRYGREIYDYPQCIGMCSISE